MKTIIKSVVASLVLATVGQAVMAFDLPVIPVIPVTPAQPGLVMPYLPLTPPSLTPTIPVIPAPQVVEPARPRMPLTPAQPSKPITLGPVYISPELRPAYVPNWPSPVIIEQPTRRPEEMMYRV